MCTLSWCRDDDGYHVYFNRDERKSRGPAQAVAVHLAADVPYLAPTDTDHGGTWLVANAHGVTLALLNRYGDPDPGPTAVRSRGLLVRSLAGAPTVAHLADRLGAGSLDAYPPLSLVAFGWEAPPRVFAWNGAELVTHRHDQHGMVITSSGAEQAVVTRSREATLAFLRRSGRGEPERAITPELLDAFHRSHLPARGGACVVPPQ